MSNGPDDGTILAIGQNLSNRDNSLNIVFP